MTDPREDRREPDEPDELELDAEDVKDLEPKAETEDAVRGGGCQTGSCQNSF